MKDEIILFNQTKQNISLHFNNCFKENELDSVSVVKESLTTLTSQNAFLKDNRGKYRKYLPFVFSEQGDALKDNYIYESTLTHLSKKSKEVEETL